VNSSDLLGKAVGIKKNLKVCDLTLGLAQDSLKLVFLGAQVTGIEQNPWVFALVENALERVVLLSGRGEPGAQRAEAALQQSGVPWTIVRASWFDQNFSEGYLLDGVLAGEIALPVGAVPEPFIDADDIAEVVIAALTNRRHAGKVYEVTGHRALTFAQAVAEIASAAGRPVNYRQIGSEEFADGMRPHVPEEYIALLLDLFTVVLDGRNSDVAHGVEQALGRPARDFADYARRTAATGVWRA